MPRGGSKKGEHRGNAKKRPDTPADVMDKALAEPGPRRYSARKRRLERIDASVQVARKIYGPTGEVRDMTPREVMLNNMHYFIQGAFDWQDHLMKVVEQPLTVESAREIEQAQMEIQRYRNLASEDAYKVAPFIHPRLAAFKNVSSNEDQSDFDIILALLNDIDAKQREPKVIEHQDDER